MLAKRLALAEPLKSEAIAAVRVSVIYRVNRSFCERVVSLFYPLLAVTGSAHTEGTKRTNGSSSFHGSPPPRLSSCLRGSFPFLFPRRHQAGRAWRSWHVPGTRRNVDGVWFWGFFCFLFSLFCVSFRVKRSEKWPPVVWF